MDGQSQPFVFLRNLTFILINRRNQLAIFFQLQDKVILCKIFTCTQIMNDILIFNSHHKMTFSCQAIYAVYF